MKRETWDDGERGRREEAAMWQENHQAIITLFYFSKRIYIGNTWWLCVVITFLYLWFSNSWSSALFASDLVSLDYYRHRRYTQPDTRNNSKIGREQQQQERWTSKNASTARRLARHFRSLSEFWLILDDRVDDGAMAPSLLQCTGRRTWGWLYFRMLRLDISNPNKNRIQNHTNCILISIPFSDSLSLSHVPPSAHHSRYRALLRPNNLILVQFRLRCIYVYHIRSICGK